MPGKASGATYLSVPQQVFRTVLSLTTLEKPKSGDDDLREREFLDQKNLGLEIAVCYPLCLKMTETVQYLSKSSDVLVVSDNGLRNITMLVVIHDNKEDRVSPGIQSPASRWAVR